MEAGVRGLTSETVVSDVKEELKPGDPKWFGFFSLAKVLIVKVKNNKKRLKFFSIF
jgi:hypothetical protein